MKKFICVQMKIGVENFEKLWPREHLFRANLAAGWVAAYLCKVSRIHS